MKTVSILLAAAAFGVSDTGAAVLDVSGNTSPKSHIASTEENQRKTIAEQQKTIATLEAFIVGQHKIIEERDKTITEKDRAIVRIESEKKELSRVRDERGVVIANLHETIKERDSTIIEKGENITQLESEKAELTRHRDTLRSDLATAREQVTTLEREKQVNQLEILRLNNDMRDESKYMPRERYDEEVKAKRKQEDDVAKASRQYTDLWNWTAIHSTERIPGKYPRTINFNVATAADPIPAPVSSPAAIATKIVTVDLGKGMVGFVFARDSEGIVKPGTYFNVHINGENVGKIRLLEVRPNNLSIAEILPGAQMVRFTRDSQVTLVPTQTIVKAPRPAAPTATAARIPPPPTVP